MGYNQAMLPPLEQAIQMLELGYSEDEVYAWWGEELLEEAATFYKDILSEEEYCRIHGCSK